MLQLAIVGIKHSDKKLTPIVTLREIRMQIIKFKQSAVLQEPGQAAEYCWQNLSINFIGLVRIKKLYVYSMCV